MTAKRGTALRAGAAALALFCVLTHAVPILGAEAPASQDGAAASGQGAAAGTSLTLKQAGKDFLGDAGGIWSSPARIRRRDVAPLVAVAAATALLIAFDEPVRDALKDFAGRHAWVGDVAPVITQMGGLAGFGTAGAFLGAGLIFKDDRARDTGAMAASAILQCLLVDNFIKALAGRQRPSVADGEDHWSGPAGFFKRFEGGTSDAYVSFPSGHAASAFSLATVVALQYGRHSWVPVMAYTLAAGVGLSRMAMDRHWASDVAVGAVIGHLVARLVVRNYARRHRVVPALAWTGRGFAFSVFIDLDPAGRWDR